MPAINYATQLLKSRHLKILFKSEIKNENYGSIEPRSD